MLDGDIDSHAHLGQGFIASNEKPQSEIKMVGFEANNEFISHQSGFPGSAGHNISRKRKPAENNNFESNMAPVYKKSQNNKKRKIGFK